MNELFNFNMLDNHPKYFKYFILPTFIIWMIIFIAGSIITPIIDKSLGLGIIVCLLLLSLLISFKFLSLLNTKLVIYEDKLIYTNLFKKHYTFEINQNSYLQIKNDKLQLITDNNKYTLHTIIPNSFLLSELDAKNINFKVIKEDTI